MQGGVPVAAGDIEVRAGIDQQRHARVLAVPCGRLDDHHGLYDQWNMTWHVCVFHTMGEGGGAG